MDHGENSTTLSSINESQKHTPEKLNTKMRNSSRLDIQNASEQCFYSFKKEVEFKEMLDNLDIENIEINLHHRFCNNALNGPDASKQLQKDLVSMHEKLNIDIEKLLSEDDEED